MEGGCQVLDELAEVDAPVGYIVEDGFVAVALVLYVAYFHLQSQVLGYLAALDHGGMFASLGLTELLHVNGTRNAIDAPYLVRALEIGFLHL